MRTRPFAAACLAAGIMTAGLLTPGPAAATPAAEAAAVNTGDQLAKSYWYYKNAKNVAGAPARKLVCTFVYGTGGSPTLGKACFQPYGDKFWVQDRRADGMHVRMRAIYSGNQQTIFDCRDYEGPGAGWTACGFAKQLRENRRIDFNVLVFNGNDMKYQGMTVTASN